MPIYEYLCGKCDHEFEVEQRITDNPVKTCPSCRSRKVKRLISQTSFVLKGRGWYSDLYASPSGKDEKTDAKESKDTKDPKDAPKSDSKAETKSKPGGKDPKKGGKGPKKGGKAAA